MILAKSTKAADPIVPSDPWTLPVTGRGPDISAVVDRWFAENTFHSREFRDVKRSAMLWRQEGLSETSDFQVQGQVSDTIARARGAVSQAAVEIGRKVVNLALDRF